MTTTVAAPAALSVSIPEAADLIGVDRSTLTRSLQAAGHSKDCRGVCGHELVAGVPVLQVGRAWRVGLYPLRAYLGAPREVAS